MFFCVLLHQTLLLLNYPEGGKPKAKSICAQPLLEQGEIVSKLFLFLKESISRKPLEYQSFSIICQLKVTWKQLGNRGILSIRDGGGDGPLASFYSLYTLQKNGLFF